MIGPPGLPKFGRRIVRFAAARTASPTLQHPIKWAAGLYLAGVLAHFSHRMAFDLPVGVDPSLEDAFYKALASAPISLLWPADLIGTLMDLS